MGAVCAMNREQEKEMSLNGGTIFRNDNDTRILRRCSSQRRPIPKENRHPSDADLRINSATRPPRSGHFSPIEVIKEAVPTG